LTTLKPTAYDAAPRRTAMAQVKEVSLVKARLFLEAAVDDLHDRINAIKEAGTLSEIDRTTAVITTITRGLPEVRSHADRPPTALRRSKGE
jgi:hypothetical protein